MTVLDKDSYVYRPNNLYFYEKPMQVPLFNIAYKRKHVAKTITSEVAIYHP